MPSTFSKSGKKIKRENYCLVMPYKNILQNFPAHMLAQLHQGWQLNYYLFFSVGTYQIQDQEHKRENIQACQILQEDSTANSFAYTSSRKHVHSMHLKMNFGRKESPFCTFKYLIYDKIVKKSRNFQKTTKKPNIRFHLPWTMEDET